MRILIIFLIAIGFGQYEYSLEDVNTNSELYGTSIWYPSLSDYITLHYFATQGWMGWTSIFGQLSDFQEELHSEGYDKVIIIGVGKDFLQDSFGETFCENSVLPLVLDTSEDFINFDIRGQFEASHKEIVIIGSDGNLLDRIVMDFDDITPYLEQMYDIIIQNYDTSILGDVNSDGTINILDIVQLANMILLGQFEQTADLNMDGTLNILDIVLIANIILDDWPTSTTIILTSPR